MLGDVVETEHLVVHDPSSRVSWVWQRHSLLLYRVISVTIYRTLVFEEL